MCVLPADPHHRGAASAYFHSMKLYVVSLHGFPVDIRSDRYPDLWITFKRARQKQLMACTRSVTPLLRLDRITNVPFNTDVAANDFLKTINNANDSAHAHITKAQERQKKGYDGLREESTFKVGDLVKLSTKDTPIEKGPAYKLKPRYVGPLEVLKVMSPVAYRITLPGNWRIHNVLHVSRLAWGHRSAY